MLRTPVAPLEYYTLMRRLERRGDGCTQESIIVYDCHPIPRSCGCVSRRRPETPAIVSHNSVEGSNMPHIWGRGFDII